MPDNSARDSFRAPFRDDPEYVRRRRQVIRDNHPDRGGSDEALIGALDALDAEWQRRTRPRPEFADVHLPGFIPEDVARQATDLAEQYTDEVLRRTEELRDRARRVVDAQTPRLRRVRKNAGRAASTMVRSVQEHLPRKFPGARRYADTGTTSATSTTTSSTTSSTTRTEKQ
ncbi:hypothetical protein [uncultured Corynebacterium sp.]|uniref:hypothetical protein n=1 Tax=uncultured Corynebacterium sp. TaxID=159447 RepID=UPI0025F56ADD|nr:hypothetical protein [uncultured Corynebacterium sp.]